MKKKNAIFTALFLVVATWIFCNSISDKPEPNPQRDELLKLYRTMNASEFTDYIDHQQDSIFKMGTREEYDKFTKDVNSILK
ncbi:MAG: hypothetical protein R3Y43_05575 [Alphaproteobacteria bacterium]